MSQALAIAEQYLRDLEARGEWREISIMTTGGRFQKKAWVAGVFAVHAMQNHLDRFVITHVPTGLNFNQVGIFRAADHAMPAALALARLRGGAGLEAPSVILSLEAEIVEIFSAARALPAEDEDIVFMRPTVWGIDLGEVRH